MWLILSIASFVIMHMYHIAWDMTLIYVYIGVFFSWLMTLAVVMFFSTFVSPFVAIMVSIVIYLLGHMMSFVVYYVTALKTSSFPVWF